MTKLLQTWCMSKRGLGPTPLSSSSRTQCPSLKPQWEGQWGGLIVRNFAHIALGKKTHYRLGTSHLEPVQEHMHHGLMGTLWAMLLTGIAESKSASCDPVQHDHDGHHLMTLSRQLFSYRFSMRKTFSSPLRSVGVKLFVLAIWSQQMPIGISQENNLARALFCNVGCHKLLPFWGQTKPPWTTVGHVKPLFLKDAQTPIFQCWPKNSTQKGLFCRPQRALDYETWTMMPKQGEWWTTEIWHAPVRWDCVQCCVSMPCMQALHLSSESRMHPLSVPLQECIRCQVSWPVQVTPESGPWTPN